MDISVIFAPSAQAAEAISAVVAKLDSGQRIELLAATGPEQVRAAVRRAVAGGAKRLLIGGGDGTIRDAITGLAPDFGSVELAFLPLGTGNDFAKSLDLPKEIESSVEIALSAPAVPADLVELIINGETSWFVNVANGGFGGKVADRVDSDQKKRWGAFAYWMSTLGTMVDQSTFQIELELDDKEAFSLSVCALAVANGRFVGGGFPIARTAQIDDGILDLTTAPPLEPGEFLTAGMDFALGREESNPLVQAYSARSVGLRCMPAMPFSIDGDLVEVEEATFRVLPGVLRLVAGNEAAALAPQPSYWTEETFDTERSSEGMH